MSFQTLVLDLQIKGDYGFTTQIVNNGYFTEIGINKESVSNLEGAEDVNDERVPVGQLSHDVMLGSQVTPVTLSLSNFALNRNKR